MIILDLWEARKAGNSIFHILNYELDPQVQFFCEQEYRLAHWCVKYELSMAAVNELIKLHRIDTNFTSVYTLYTEIDEMPYKLGIDEWKSDTVSYTDTINSDVLYNDGKMHFYLKRT
jgi:hypothetical protein